MDLPPIGLQAVLDDKNFQDGLKRFNSGTDEMMSRTSSVASILSGTLVAAFGVAVAAIGGFVAISKVGLDATMQWGAELGELSDQFGMDGTEASKWAVAMKHVGLSVQEGAGGLNFFTKSLDDMKKASSVPKIETKDNTEAIKKLKEQVADANVQLQRAQINLSKAKQPTDQMKWAVEDAQKKVNRLNAELASTPATISKLKPAADTLSPFGEALKKLGVSAYDAKGKLKTFDQIMPQIMDAFQKLPAGVNSTALAMDLFGTRGGTKFLDFLKQGSAGLQEAERFAEQFGLEIESDGVDAVEGFEFAMNDLQLALTGIWNTIGFAVLPHVQSLVDFVKTQILPTFSQWAFDIMPVVSSTLYGIGKAAGEVFKLIKEQKWDELSAKFWSWVDTAKTAASNKLGEITTAIANYLKDHWEPDIKPKLLEWAGKFWEWVTGKNGVIESLATELGKLLEAFRKWTESDDTKKQLQGFGASMGSTMVKAVGSLFDSAGKQTGEGSIAQAIVKMLGDAVKGSSAAIREIGAGMGTEIINGLMGGLLDNGNMKWLKDWFLNTYFPTIFKFWVGPLPGGGSLGGNTAKSFSVPSASFGAPSYSSTSTTNNFFNLSVNSSSQPTRVASDFGIMRSLAGA